jgi:hypothetical protein
MRRDAPLSSAERVRAVAAATADAIEGEVIALPVPVAD